MRIGVDLGGTKIEFSAISAEGHLLVRNRVPAPQNKYQDTLEAIRDGVLHLEAMLNRSGSVGIGIPGTISPYTGLVRGANSTWLIGHPLDKDLESILGRPVRVENDANCFTLSEAIDGAGKGHDVVFGVILGTGVGGGVVINRRLIPGQNGIAGEWGHSPQPGVTVTKEYKDSVKRTCYCGKQNCIETFLSGPGFSRSHSEIGGLSATPPEIIERWQAGDSVADSSISRYEEQLARALAGIINLLDPNVIVLGGGMSNVERLYETVPRLWQNWCFSDRINTLLVPPKHGDSSGVRGAAWLWPHNQ